MNACTEAALASPTIPLGEATFMFVPLLSSIAHHLKQTLTHIHTTKSQRCALLTTPSPHLPAQRL